MGAFRFPTWTFIEKWWQSLSIMKFLPAVELVRIGKKGPPSRVSISPAGTQWALQGPGHLAAPLWASGFTRTVRGDQEPSRGIGKARDGSSQRCAVHLRGCPRTSSSSVGSAR